MPIFQKRIHFKAPPSRTGRVSEAVCPRIIKNTDDCKNLHLNLSNEKELRFADGIWIQHSATGHSKTTELNVDDLLKLKSKMDRLEQENNLLQVKVDLLIDLLTENMCKEEFK